ncbi:hypothetical protein [Planctomonas deserti]|uniref:hypothetical protein n=1 Tax=Planctomonas deserti TaxID=2144185 RepID=UPI000D34A03B|nr:hypothetical protein [Planctomonas deserti]
MRWDDLFDDLESQLEQGRSAEEEELLAEEERLRLGRLSLRDRLAAIARTDPGEEPAPVRVLLSTGLVIDLRPRTFGRDWVAGDLDPGRESGAAPRGQCILPVRAISSLLLDRGQVRRSLREPGPARGITDRLGLPFVLRDLCRRRSPLELHLPDGVLHGTIDRVGRDHCDLALHEPGSPRRESAVTAYRVVAIERVALVRV